MRIRKIRIPNTALQTFLKTITDPKGRSDLTMVVANVAYLLEGVELERAIFVDWGPDIVAVLGIAHLLQLTHARHVRQAQLHIRL
jgi:hypothetical protein